MNAVPAAGLDLVCVSYLADAQVLRVDDYPSANRGAPVREVISSLAADGPLTALAAAGLGLRAGLLANQVGADLSGQRLLTQLSAAGVQHDITTDATRGTPQLTVVTDNATRTWFACLDHAYHSLRQVDLAALAQARLAYIDCYTVLTDTAVRAITAAAHADTPVLLNLGGDPLQPCLAAAVKGVRVAAVQTSLDESDAAQAEPLAAHLYRQLRPDAVVVTLGRIGALAYTGHEFHHASARPAQVRHTHGAGAAFSAGYAHAQLTGATINTALRAGCHTATARCLNPA